MTLPTISNVAAGVGAVLIVSALVGCGGGGDADNIAKGIASLNEGNRAQEEQLRKAQAEQTQTHARQKEALDKVGKDVARNAAQAEAQLRDIVEMRGRYNQAVLERNENAQRMRDALDEKIRKSDASLKTYRDHFAATKQVLESARIERQRLLAAGSLSAARLYEFLDFSTHWNKLANLYLDDLKNGTDPDLLLKMQRLAHRTSATAAEDDPSDVHALEILSQRRKRETAEIGELLKERQRRMVNAAGA